MESLVNMQFCHNTGHYQLVPVPSHSDPTVVYDVLVMDPNDEPGPDVICHCDGFAFRGHCSHQQEALDSICGWTELDGPEKQSEDQHQNQVCPRCGWPTGWRLEVIDE